MEEKSFMLNHWMESHQTSAIPPSFSFRVISKHKDALSRQIKEAVLIKSRGNLNKKCEFASYEIVRLESKKYTWDQNVADKERKKIEKEQEEKLENFINVMKSIHNDDKRKMLNTQNDIATCSRFDGEFKCGPKRRRRMSTSTSTPIAYHARSQILHQ